MDLATVRCTTCEHDLGSSVYAPDDDHKEAGLVSGLAAAHKEAHPKHRLSFSRRSAKEAERERKAAAKEEAAREREGARALKQTLADRARTVPEEATA